MYHLRPYNSTGTMYSSKKKNMELFMINKPNEGAIVVVIVWYLELPVQSVPITTKVVSSNPAHVDAKHN